MDKQKICYVDDADANLALIKEIFSAEFEIFTIDNAVSAVDKISDIGPDLILLDVNMPGVDGYQICKTIREQNQFKNTPIVFLTSRKGLEDRLMGFEAGGDAYITKPFDIKELRYIVKSQLSHYHQFKEMEVKADSASEMVWTMMKSSSEIGEVVQYARNLSKVQDAEALATKTFDTFSQFCLKSALSLKFDGGEQMKRCDGQLLTPIEKELMDLAYRGGRISNVGRKFIFCGEKSIFLIKNMPIEDDELTGRLRDHVAIMLESCDSCVELINYRQQERNVNEKCADSTQHTIVNELERIKLLFDGFTKQKVKTFENLEIKIEESFLYLGLNEEQEEQIMSLIEDARLDLEQFENSGTIMQKALDKATNSLMTLRTRLKQSVPG